MGDMLLAQTHDNFICYYLVLNYIDSVTDFITDPGRATTTLTYTPRYHHPKDYYREYIYD